MKLAVRDPIKDLREAFDAVKATTLPSTAHESALLVKYTASLLVVAEADMHAALKEVTQHYVEAQRSGSRNFRESVRAGWIALFRRAAGIRVPQRPPAQPRGSPTG